jgi:hypothetical protein
VLPKKRHKAVGKDSGQTNHIERFNCTLRQRISRLVRKTLSFSKKLENHIGAIWTFIHHYNSEIQAEFSVMPSRSLPSSFGRFAAIANSESKNGGQVVETQGYHLEFVPEKTDKGAHLDFYLQKGDNHSSVGNANVKAEVTMPDGKKQTLSLKYDPKEKHYTALLETKATGDFKVAILSEIAGKKVNGSFSFKR